MNAQQEFIQQLVESETKISLNDFFRTIHARFYPTQDISFMEYFLELTEHEGEFIVHHNKLVEYGVMSSKQSADVKVKLDVLGLVKNEDYQLRDISELRPQGGTSTKNIYMLTPEAFKTCLMRARKYPGQTVDPAVYSKYYLLLEKTHKLYTDYEKQLLNKQLVQKDQQLEEERQYNLNIQERLLVNSTPVTPVQIIYHQTLRV
jgi:hypothetical protein